MYNRNKIIDRHLLHQLFTRESIVIKLESNRLLNNAITNWRYEGAWVCIWVWWEKARDRGYVLESVSLVLTRLLALQRRVISRCAHVVIARLQLKHGDA